MEKFTKQELEMFASAVSYRLSFYYHPHDEPKEQASLRMTYGKLVKLIDKLDELENR